MITYNPTFPGIKHPTMRNLYTFCLRCHSTIFWNDLGNPQIMQFGNEHLKTCLQQGCSLVVQQLKRELPDNVVFASLDPAHC